MNPAKPSHARTSLKQGEEERRTREGTSRRLDGLSCLRWLAVRKGKRRKEAGRGGRTREGKRLKQIHAHCERQRRCDHGPGHAVGG